MSVLHIGHPDDGTIIGLSAVVGATLALPGFGVGLDGWKALRTTYENNQALPHAAFIQRVLSTPGPVLLVQPVRGSDLAEIRRRLEPRQIVQLSDVYDAPTLLDALATIARDHAAGHPLTAKDAVVALLLMNKLDKERRWAGNNDKGYMWHEDLPNGRGFDPQFADRLPHVINLLFQHEVLIYKISKGKKKWALNPKDRNGIYAILRERSFDIQKPQLAEKLRQTPGLVSVRELDGLGEFHARTM